VETSAERAFLGKGAKYLGGSRWKKNGNFTEKRGETISGIHLLPCPKDRPRWEEIVQKNQDKRNYSGRGDLKA